MLAEQPFSVFSALASRGVGLGKELLKRLQRNEVGMSGRGRSLEKLLQNLLEQSDWRKLPLSGRWVEKSRQDSGVRGPLSKKKEKQTPKLALVFGGFYF